MVSLAAANAEFCCNLFKEMNSNQVDGNIFFSPLSLFTTLAVLQLGARGDCASQIEKVLHFSKFTGPGNSSRDQVDQNSGLHSQLHAVLSEINTSHNGYQLNIANGLFAEKAFEFHKNYLECAEKLYKARVKNVDFTTGIEETMKDINSWIENQTSGKIKNLFQDGSIGSSAVMVLVNAIYFKGKWKSGFIQSETLNYRFKSHKCAGKTIHMMHQEQKFNLSDIEDPKMQILELRYDGEMNMYVMLPENNLAEVESKLTYPNLMRWTSPSKMKLQHVEVFLPRFKMESSHQVKQQLKALGMTDAFDESRADLSGIASGGRLYVSKLVHKSYVEVTEEGTEAAALTGNVIVEKQMPDFVVFRADRPFLFFIKHKDVIVFFGRVSCP